MNNLFNICVIAVVLFGGLIGTTDTPENIGEYLKSNIYYTADKNDHWQTAEETLQRGEGDCEDFSILAQYYLDKIGIKGQIVYYNMMKGKDWKAHAICIFKERDGTYSYISTEKYQKVNGKSIRECCDWSAKRAGAEGGAMDVIPYTDKMVKDKIDNTKSNH